MSSQDPLPDIRERENAVLVKVRASPGASGDRLAGFHGGALKVMVSAPPERGRANLAVRRLLASALALKPAQVVLHSGETARDKWFRIEGVTAEAVRERLRQAVTGRKKE
jgi:uncharacterized protein (TIGR00251 family)